MLTGIIFDFDGTLIDSIPAHMKVLKKIAKRHGMTITNEAFSHYNGMSSTAGFRKIMHEHHLHFSALKIAWELFKAKKDIRNHVSIFPETKACLQRLKGYDLAVATSSHRDYLNELTRRFGIQHYFSALISASDVRHSKPSPEIFLKAAKQLGKKPEESVVIEDSLNGVIAAKRAGIPVIAILTTTKKELFVGEATPDLFIQTLDDLRPSLLKHLEKRKV